MADPKAYLAAGGDMDAQIGMLAPDVLLHADGGGKTQAIAKPLAGRQPCLAHARQPAPAGQVRRRSPAAGLGQRPAGRRCCTTPKAGWSA